MSRKNKMILNKQQRLKTKRIRKINFRKMRRAKKNGTSDIVCNNNVVPDGPDQWTVVNINNKNNNSEAMMANCDLYDIWSKACHHYDIPEDSMRSWYDRIFHKLNEDTAKRIYHNWSCMLAPKRIELEKAKPQIVFAAFFQYYEFDLEKSCVQENCDIFNEFCQDGMVEDEDMKQLVCILLGKKSTEPLSADVDDDMAILQDLDLLILASTPNVYKNYVELSRQEWLNSGKTNYYLLRRKTLTTLLALDIYQTTEFCTKYSEAARANIEQELKELGRC